MDRQNRAGPQRSEFVRWARAGVLVGVVAIVALPMLTASWKRHHAPAPQASAPAQQQLGAGAQPPLQLANFGGEQASPDARLLANWVVATRNNHRHAFILVDKKDARAYVFAPDGRLRDSAPVLLGEAHGDDVLPGVGDKPLSQVTPEEKTTPSGRFVAEPGMNTDDEDVIWVDYDDAISMHRVRPWVEAEHRLERLASLTTDDNRISFGCINLPVRFYEDVAKPAVTQYGAIIYVLPERKTVQQVFGAWDVTDPAQVAAARPTAAPRPAVQG